MMTMPQPTRACLAAIVLAAGASPAMAAPFAMTSAYPIVADQPADLTARNGQTAAHVVVKVGRPAAGGYANSAHGRPRTTVTRLDISVSGQPVRAPVSAIADLTDLYRVSLRPDGDGYALEFVGGAGPDVYQVELHFNASGVNRRILRPGGSGRWTERTEYREVASN